MQKVKKECKKHQRNKLNVSKIVWNRACNAIWHYCSKLRRFFIKINGFGKMLYFIFSKFFLDLKEVTYTMLFEE